MSFLAPLYLALLALAVPILLLWFLKQKREPLTVPTIFLWKRAVQEEQVSPLLRNLTRSILLLLQLVALLLLALAAAEAVLNLRLSGDARRVILIVDRSASMGTREGGRTRLELARERAKTLIGTLRSSDRAMLVAFDEDARILSGFTGETAALERLLAGIRPVDRGTDPAPAFAAAAAAAAALPGGSLELFLFSDGAFPAVPDLPPALKDAAFSFVGVGEAEDNCGIVGMELDAGLEGPARLFVRVANPMERPAVRTLALLRGETTLDAREAEIGPRSVSGAGFDLSAFGPGPLELRLSPDDALAADDRAFVVRREPAFRRVLVVTEESRILTRLKDLQPRVEVYTVKPGELTDSVGEGIGRFDLTIFDGFAPESPRPGTGNLGPSAVYLDCVPPGSDIVLAEPVKNPSIVDWSKNHPLNRSVDWTEVLVARASPVSGAEEATTILEATEGPLVVALPGAGTRVVFGFRLEDSNMALRLAFPIFFANIFDRAFRGTAGDTGFLRTGDILTRAMPPGSAEATLTTPAGEEVKLTPLPDGTVSWAGFDRAGFYRLGNDEIAVSFLSEAETDIRPRPQVEVEGSERRSDPKAVETNYPLRWPLLVAALLTLLLEWILWLLRSVRRSLRARPVR